MTVSYDGLGEARSYDLYRLSYEMGDFGQEDLVSEAEYTDWLAQLVSDIELELSVLIEGHESVVFMAPMGAHNAIAIETWQAVAQWDLQTDDNDVVQAVRYGASPDDPEYSQPLTELRTRITTAACHGWIRGSESRERLRPDAVLLGHRRVRRHHTGRRRHDDIHTGRSPTHADLRRRRRRR